MKNTFTKSVLFAAMAAVSIGASAAEDEIDLDDITMDIVSEGSFDANQLNRPDRRAITQYRANAEAGMPDAESRAEFWQQRADELPEGTPQPTDEMRAQFEALHEALASGDTDSAADIRELIESQMSELGLAIPEGAPDFVGGRPDSVAGFAEGRPQGSPDFASGRPEGAPDFEGGRPDFAGERPEDAPSREEIREIIESGDEDAIAELRELWADRKSRGPAAPQD
ncbi:MAG: hypothetical protein AB8B48_07490 [Pseudomonadales bacterium]